MGKLGVWSLDKRALSPIFATLLLATIIIVFGSVAFYYSSNLTRTATNNYVKTISDSQQAISERIGFENVVYTSSNLLTVYIINCGSANNVQINSVFLYDSDYNIKGVYSVSAVPNPISVLNTIDGGTPIPGNSLNIGKEGVFTVTLGSGTSLSPGSMYTIHLITKSGSSFDHDFTA